APRPRRLLPPARAEGGAARAALPETPHVILASQVWTDVFWTSVVAGGLLAGVPLMFTALGETISERAGVLNIGLEGMMLVGAYVGFLGAHYTGSQWAGYAAGIGGGTIASVFMVVLCVWLGLDQIVVGIAITLAGEGITSVAQQAQFGSTYPRLGAPSTISIPLLHRLPVLGTSLFEQPVIVYLAFGFVAVLAWTFRKTNVGLAGLGGAYLSVAATGIFTPFLTQGQGFIAIVIAMLGRGRPLWVLCGSFLFGIALSLSDSLQIAGIDISTDVVHMIPFAAIIVALILFARRSYLPPALALPYVRGQR